MPDDRRLQRREIRLLNSQAVWLQKALFALRKAHDTHEKIADLHDVKPDPYTIRLEDQGVPVESLEDALEARTAELVRDVRERRNRLV